MWMVAVANNLLADTKSDDMSFITPLKPLTQQGPFNVSWQAWLQGSSTHVPVFHLPTECEPLCGLGCLACHPDGKDLLCCV
jgi:hypothetical protein